MRTSQAPRGSSGFTLVELLMAIAIIGVLASLSVYGITVAMRAANEARISAEINQLSQAMESFKGKYGFYPPAFRALQPDPTDSTSTTAYNAYLNAERARMVRYISRMFPKFSPRVCSDAGLGRTFNAADSTSDFTDVQYMMRAATQATAAGTAPDAPGANFPAASTDTCDLTTLDPAEALVFWLGGFPHRIDEDGSPTTLATKILHLEPFSADPSNPIMHEEFAPQRLEPFFQFDLTRLVDIDKDGWPEYVPGKAPKQGQVVAPYVYFDAGGSYTMAPLLLASYPNPGLADELGYCRPYAMDVVGDANPPTAAGVTSWEVQWMNPDSFQIIAPGIIDNQYGPREGFDPLDPKNPTGDKYTIKNAFLKPQLSRFPSGKLFGTPWATGAEPIIHSSELDNQTNFVPGRIESQLKLQ